jgi:predicted DNA-binding protein
MMYDMYIMKRTQIYLEADQDRRIASRATASGVTKSTLIREAIEAYLVKPDDADELAAFRAAIDAAAGAPVKLPDGATSVDTIRAADVARQAELDERRG